jgi:hypothetical protein
MRCAAADVLKAISPVRTMALTMLLNDGNIMPQ